MDISALAQRIIDVDYYGAMDADATIETVSDELLTCPMDVITWLLEVIEDLQV